MTVLPSFLIGLWLILPGVLSCKQEATETFRSCLHASVGLTTSQEAKAECTNGGETVTSCYPKLLDNLVSCSDTQKMTSAKILAGATKQANLAYLCKDRYKLMKEVLVNGTCWYAINDCIQVFIAETSLVYGRSDCKVLRASIDGCKVTIRRLRRCNQDVYPTVNQYFKYFLSYTPCGYPNLPASAVPLYSNWSSWTWLPFLLWIFFCF